MTNAKKPKDPGRGQSGTHGKQAVATLSQTQTRKDHLSLERVSVDGPLTG